MSIFDTSFSWRKGEGSLISAMKERFIAEFITKTSHGFMQFKNAEGNNQTKKALL